MVTPAARREAVAHLEESLEVSERRACSIIAADRSVVRYLSRRPDDTVLRARLRELADQRRRFGYRRLHVLLRSAGLDPKPQEDPAALRRGRAGGPPAPVTAAHRGGAHADPEAGWPQQPLVDGLRSRPAGQRPSVPSADHHRRRNQGVPRRRPGHLAERQAGGARDERADRPARPARRNRQRQWHRAGP